eukprot:3809509-Rhodomonas_salina.3
MRIVHRKGTFARGKKLTIYPAAANEIRNSAPQQTFCVQDVTQYWVKKFQVLPKLEDFPRRFMHQSLPSVGDLCDAVGSRGTDFVLYPVIEY